MSIITLVLVTVCCLVSGEVTYYPAAYDSLGCWSDECNASPSAEGNPLFGGDNYAERELAISKCARVAAQQGKVVFTLQDGGKCSTFCTSYLSYLMRTKSISCPSDGKGSSYASNVYELRTLARVRLENLGCWRDTLDRAIPTLEGQDPVLDGEYWDRKESIAKCVQATYKRGFSVFAVQDGGWCASSANASETYRKYGQYNTCGSDGEGGSWGNQVYRIHRISESYFSTL